MRVGLFVTCLVDQFWPSAGEATVEVLRSAGCEVAFDARQTCCGQPAFNSGFRKDARDLAQRTIELFEADGCEALVMPSGSCTAMLHHFEELFEQEDPWHARAKSLASKTHELGAFLVRVLERTDLGAQWSGRLTWHDACHGLRDLGLRDEPRRLLSAVTGAEFVEAPGADTCCGFGGTFSVKFPELSIAMLDQKLQALEQLEVDAIVSGDVSCLMQIGGRLQHRGSSLKTLHLAEVLASRREPATGA